MGLSGPKKRVKLSHDPNNTSWTNDTQSFGHRMMTSQGWAPGQYLGVQNSAHSEFHTAANASHIRVAIKDDNLGLGAKNGSGVGHGECTGLDVFKNILGRLNGKDEGEIQKEIRDREDLKRALYTERKWGSIRFVKGGLLVGDKIQDLIEGEKERVQKLKDGKSESSDSDDSSESEEEAAAPVEKSKKSKKRKAEALAEPVAEVVAIKIKKAKKSKKSKSHSEDDVSAALEEVKISKKSKKGRKPKDESEESGAQSDSQKRKRERNERRAQKAMRKAKKEKKKSEEESSDSSVAITKENTAVVVVSTQTSGRSTPNPMMQGRHAVRSRNIAQKRLAALDGAALNQIFMIKG